MGLLTIIKDGAARLHKDIYPLAASVFDRRTPLAAKILAAMVVGYAISPIDLIPDFIPFAGWIDDVLIIGFGIRAVRRLIPPEVWAESQIRAAPAEQKIARALNMFRWAAFGMIAAGVITCILAALVVYWIVKTLIQQV